MEEEQYAEKSDHGAFGDALGDSDFSVGDVDDNVDNDLLDDDDIHADDDHGGNKGSPDVIDAVGRAKLSVALGSTTDLPEEHKNVIRIFLSSTFTDMSVERNILMTETFPKLKKYCQESYGQQFQVVDMRWGVQDQANDDHSTSELCMREIINCQKESAGPNFVLLLGNRYGTRYLKKSISVEHWNILTSHIHDSKVKELLDIWYKEDTNSIPSRYILQSISSVENGSEVWEDKSKQMYDAISKAAVEARTRDEMSAETVQEYIRSVTEEEVDIAGILSDNQKQKTNCLVFVRQINNIDLQHPKSKRFIDMTEAKEKDEERQDLLSKLTQKVKANMPSENIKEYSVDWSDADGINAEDHKDYLQKFSDDFYNEIKRMVDAAAASEDQTARVVHEHKLCREVLAHSRLALDKLSKVVPRTDILDQIKSYVAGDSNQPMVVHGHSGCGKTSVMASVATQCREWLGNGDKTAVILRFLGTTQQSSDIELLLESLNHQLSSFNSMNLSIKRNSNKTLKELTAEFEREIKSAGKKKGYKLVIVLDSIDQLRKNDHAFSLAWLPRTLPSNVKLVISTLPEIFGILKAARSLGLSGNNFVEVKTLAEDTAWMIIDKWLEMSQRKLTSDQREAVTSVFKDKPLPPLYIKLIFDILVKWRSYDQAKSIPTDVISSMEQLFSTLENTHGKLQIELALCYLTCCPGGISQTELEDTLSIDDSFLTAVFQYHVPPLRRIPPTLWVRIKNDIRDYIVEKESNGVAVMYWYHRQFIEFATRRYVEGEQIKQCLTTLSDYFTGKWSDRPKPFIYAESQMKKLNLTDSSAQALRLVASQPTRYSKQKFNTRKVSVLSQIWSDENLKEMVFINSSRYIMDIQFLTAKFTSDSWGNINTELSSFASYMRQKDELTDEEKIYSTEYTYLYSVLSMYNGLISQSPYTCSAQLFACLQDKYNLSAPKPPTDSKLPNLAWFLKELTSGQGVDMCPLLPVSKLLDSPGGIQVLVRLSASLGKLFPFKFNGKSAIATMSEEMIVYTIQDDGSITEALSMALMDPSDYATHISFDKDENYIFANSSGVFKLISLENKRVELDVSELELDPKNDYIIFTSERMKVFYNPLVKGRDSIMFCACERELAVVYSMKTKAAVWHHYILEPEDGSLSQEEIYHISVHNTDQDCVKELVVVFSKHTDVYTMELQEDGGAKVSLKEAMPNAFCQKKGVKAVARRVTDFVHGENQMSVILPDELPFNKMFMLSDQTSMQKNVWSYYELSRKTDIFMAGRLKSETDILMAGRLRSGTDIIATLSRSKKYFLIELYSVKGYNNIELSAAFYTKALQLNSAMSYKSKMYLVPNSDVLLFLMDTKVYLFFLKELDWPMIKVTYCYSIVVGNSHVIDILADPFGYLVVNSIDKSTKFWDLTLYSDSVKTGNPRLKSIYRCKHLLSFPAPHNLIFVVEGNGHIWDVTTNGYIGVLPVDFGRKMLLSSQILLGDGKWDHIIYVIGRKFLASVGVKLPNSEGSTLEMEQLKRAELAEVSEVLLYDQGVLIMNKEQMLYQCNKETVDNQEGSDVTIKSYKLAESNFTHRGWCFTDKYLIVSGDEENEDAFIVGFTDTEAVVLFFDATSSFKLLKRIEKHSFTYAAYFKNFDITILVDSSYTDTRLNIFDPEAMDIKPVKIPAQYSPDKLHMLEIYNKDECCYCTDKQPYFFIQCSDGILKLDVTKWKSWESGEGVVYLGDLPSNWGSIRLSTSRTYIAGVTQSRSSIGLVKLTEDSLVPLGLFTLQGDAYRLNFSYDDQYITSILTSGEIVCMKVLDVTSPDLEAEVAKLPCAQNKVCQTQKEMLSDPRWTSLDSGKSINASRSEDTLYNFMEKFSKETNKAAFPLVGDELNKSSLALEFPQDFHGTPAEFTPRIKTKPLDVESLLKSLDIVDQKEGELLPHPPAGPKPLNNIGPLSYEPNAVDSNILPPGDIPFPPPLPPQKLETPKNLKLYHSMPTEEREKKLDTVIEDINKKSSAMCSIL